METRPTWTFALVVASLVSVVPAAHADLTVSFATDSVPAAFSVSVVERAAEAEAEVTRTAPEPDPAVTSEAEQEQAAPEPERVPAPPDAELPAVRARIVRVGDGSGESATLALRDASPGLEREALEQLSVLARPRGVDAPGAIDHDDPEFVAPGIRRLHAGLLPLLARLSEHFPGRSLEIVSGYRPNAREGSRHRFGRALDLRVEGVAIDEVRAYLDGEPCTGVGLYPTSGFVHLDVRTQSVRWVDDSGPGEASHVVRSEVVGHAETAPRTQARPRSEAPTTVVDQDAIERAMQAADTITLDFALPR